MEHREQGWPVCLVNAEARASNRLARLVSKPGVGLEQQFFGCRYLPEDAALVRLTYQREPGLHAQPFGRHCVLIRGVLRLKFPRLPCEPPKTTGGIFLFGDGGATATQSGADHAGDLLMGDTNGFRVVRRWATRAPPGSWSASARHDRSQCDARGASPERAVLRPPFVRDAEAGRALAASLMAKTMPHASVGHGASSHPSAAASTAARGHLAAVRLDQEPLTEGVPGLGRVVGRESDVDIVPGHAGRDGCLDVDPGIREPASSLGEGARLVGERGRDELDRAVLPLPVAQRAPRAGLITGQQHDRTAVAAGRPAEGGDVDPLLGDRFGHLGKLAWLVLEVHDERIHRGTSMATPTRTTGGVVRRRGSMASLYFTPVCLAGRAAHDHERARGDLPRAPPHLARDAF